jgi:membrane associated rhomboid family serine protease
LVFVLQTLSNSLLGGDLLLALGAKVNSAIAAGEIWRLVTPIFLHIGLLHVGVNMYSLYVVGPPVERLFGLPRMLTIYFLSGVAGVAFSLAFSAAPSAGASGAIFGLLGALAGFLLLHRRLFGKAANVQLTQIALVAVLNLAIGLSPGIDNWGHLGGLVAGLALAYVIGPRFEVAMISPAGAHWTDRRGWDQVWTLAALAAVVIVLFSLAAAHSPFSG